MLSRTPHARAVCALTLGARLHNRLHLGGTPRKVLGSPRARRQPQLQQQGLALPYSAATLFSSSPCSSALPQRSLLSHRYLRRASPTPAWNS